MQLTETERGNILVLCTGNSCRSQMAEALLRKHAGDRFNVHSAGLEPKPEIHPSARQVMSEIGVDLAAQHPKDVRQYLGRLGVRHLIVVCSLAEEKCPRLFPGVLHRHYWPFDDPAAATGSEAERLAVFRRVRDEIDHRIRQWLESAGQD